MGKTIISYEEQNLFCFNLPSKPKPKLGKILVTGASGYVGGRLVPELLARQYKVRVMLRAASPEYKTLWPQAEIVFADALEIDSLREAFEGIHTIYYLIHSLLLGPKHFEATDLKAAVNVAQAAKEKKVKRIIYLGGLGDVRSCISSHLQSRIQVAEKLKSSGIPVTLLRAAIIIGSGSASYEIVHHLVKRSRVLPMPNWGKTKCQPISIRDVIKYLVGVLESPDAIDKEYDIGGLDILSYGEMLKIFAKILNKKKFFFPSPISKPKYYAYLSSLLTPVPATICRCLMEGLKDEVICQNNNIKNIIKFEPISFKEAIIRAMTREEQDKVHTRWSDAYP
ncbi:MAG: NmrA family NAD(P)-binding protein, partial [Calditrichia bacterium]|nr:NmrA family NAD(P)-binding protein [Calditrichia bacterium]